MDPAALTRTQFILQEFLREKHRENCPVPSKIARRTNCQCLRELLKHHQEEVTQALDLFFGRTNDLLKEVKTNTTNKKKRKTQRIQTNNEVQQKPKYLERTVLVEKQKSIADQYRWNSESTNHPLNNIEHPAYELPAPTPMPDGGVPTVILCRGAMIELTKRIQDVSFEDAMNIFPPAEESPETKERKRKLFYLMRYFFSATLSPDQKIPWKAMSEIAIPPVTKKRWVNKYQLCQIASGGILSVGLDDHMAWLSSHLQARLIHISAEALTEALPLLVNRGKVKKGYVHVDYVSMGEVKTGTKSVLYRKIDCTFSSDAQSLRAIRDYFQPLIAETLGAQDQCVVDSAFLKSPHYAPQLCHYDMGIGDRDRLRNKIFLGFSPLTDSGCYLQVWLPRENETSAPQRGRVLFIPKGCILLLPGDTLHGGGFLSDYKTLDLRLHFYIYIHGATPLVMNNNVYQLPDIYPMQESLMPKQSVHNLFTSNLTP